MVHLFPLPLASFSFAEATVMYCLLPWIKARYIVGFEDSCLVNVKTQSRHLRL